MLVEWREEFTVGVPSLDHEHQELIRLINAAYERAKAAGSKPDVDGFLSEIFAHIGAHFALEERIMRAADYDQRTEHKADHERLLDEIREIMDDQESRSSVDVHALSEHLNRWFGEHFRTHDARFHLQLRL